jgi:hypothetical protein
VYRKKHAHIKSPFDIIVVVTFQNILFAWKYIKIIFYIYILKFIFNISLSEQSKNIKNNLIWNKKKLKK